MHACQFRISMFVATKSNACLSHEHRGMSGKAQGRALIFLNKFIRSNGSIGLAIGTAASPEVINGSKKTESGLDNMERERGGGGTAAKEKRRETVQIKETV